MGPKQRAVCSARYASATPRRVRVCFSDHRRRDRVVDDRAHGPAMALAAGGRQRDGSRGDRGSNLQIQFDQTDEFLLAAAMLRLWRVSTLGGFIPRDLSMSSTTC